MLGIGHWGRGGTSTARRAGSGEARASSRERGGTSREREKKRDLGTNLLSPTTGECLADAAPPSLNCNKSAGL